MAKTKEKAEKKRKATSSPWARIMNSKTHGRGLFAKKDIPAGEYIIEYVGEYVTKEESDKRGWEHLDHGTEAGDGHVYLFVLNDEVDIDGAAEYNTARLINHSCDPNCETEVCQGENGDEIWVLSLKEIKEGEELSFNYGFDLEDYENHPCLCGSEKCVGYIAAEEYWDELAAALKKKDGNEEKMENGVDGGQESGDA